MSLLIDLDPVTERRLAQQAAAQGIEISELVRRFVSLECDCRTPEEGSGSAESLRHMFDRWNEEDATIVPTSP